MKAKDRVRVIAHRREVGTVVGTLPNKDQEMSVTVKLDRPSGGATHVVVFESELEAE